MKSASDQAAIRYEHLAPNPKSFYRQLFIKGTRIRARVIYGVYMDDENPRTAEEIAADYNIPVEAVKEAIAYCESNPPEIGEDFAAEEALIAATGTNTPNDKHDPRRRTLTPQEHAEVERVAREAFRQNWRAQGS